MWGSIADATTSDPCTNCPHYHACKQAVHQAAPVQCETGPDSPPLASPTHVLRGRARVGAKTWTRRDYAAHIRPGEAVTAVDLAARAGGTAHNAGNWLSTQTAAGVMTHAGKYHTGDTTLTLYRFKESATSHAAGSGGQCSEVAPPSRFTFHVSRFKESTT